jgi:hypothetical protein
MPTGIKKRGSKKRTFSARYAHGRKGFLIVELEMHCSYCRRNEMINVTYQFAGKFKGEFAGAIAQADSYGWLISSHGNIEQKYISRRAPAVMCPECCNSFEAQAKKLRKELEFYGDGVYAICNPNA